MPTVLLIKDLSTLRFVSTTLNNQRSVSGNLSILSTLSTSFPKIPSPSKLDNGQNERHRLILLIASFYPQWADSP